MTEAKRAYYNKKDIEFHNFEDISFPTICLLCGKETKSHIIKEFYGRLYDAHDFKKNHLFAIPVCSKCKGILAKDKTGENKAKNKVVWLSLVGVGLAVGNFFLTYSLFFSIFIVALFFLIPFSEFRIKYKSEHRIELEDYLKIEITKYGNSIKLKFKNKDYARFVHDLNSDIPAPDHSITEKRESPNVKSLTSLIGKTNKPEIDKDEGSDNPFRFQNKKLCPGCGAFNDGNSGFCIKCGGKLS